MKKQQDKIYIYGKHAVAEALTHMPQAVHKVHVAPEMDDPKLRTLIHKSGVLALQFTGKAPGEAADVSHQGIFAQISTAGLLTPYEKFIANLEVSPSTSLVLLGELQDPHNVGAVIRSAAAFGAKAVLIPEHNQAPVTGTVVKVSAGMAFRIPLVSIGNVNHTVRDLKEKGFWVYGLAGEGAQPLPGEKFDAPALFILGNEAKGIREKTRDLCDILLSIPIDEKCESLNAAASAATVLYAWSTQHPDALSPRNLTK